MQELVLAEMNPMNPWYGQKGWHGTASKLGWARRESRRNPMRRRRNATALALPHTLKGWTFDVSPTMVIAGAAGLIAASMIPTAVIPGTPEELTTLKKVGRIALAIASTMAVAAAAKAFVNDKPAGQAAFIGGMAGVVIQSVNVISGRTLIGGIGGNRGAIRERTTIVAGTRNNGARVAGAAMEI